MLDLSTAHPYCEIPLHQKPSGGLRFGDPGGHVCTVNLVMFKKPV